jgi:hypothetical protein
MIIPVVQIDPPYIYSPPGVFVSKTIFVLNFGG